MKSKRLHKKYKVIFFRGEAFNSQINKEVHKNKKTIDFINQFFLQIKSVT